MSIFDPPYLKSRLGVSEFERVDVPGFELPIDEDGCVKVPTELREQLLIEGAGLLMAEVVDGELRLIAPKSAIRKAKRLMAE